ncbi:adenylosuccinate synthase [Lentimicrobium sp.]|jgi:adenylosuccinate synthase|uniref:adenylosuccinate synthase n=3 Tax=Lentimicrobium sp. TaxID=2034841 RepID=UPI0025DADEFF|nr:adenylosuccinate synthase [Lentimicrobium sp.]MCO5258426.1 adenylosuccinate synthase [Lentimicrobium sp.]MCO5263924.1 adenylosuccinate synthase [Lentimicrobium sp.]HOP13351.1 adenylosuccinate synthase [Lentimicrobium sp.]HPF64287.1 adenylosuccinate synthase [Lentimicrobium sp.]HPJ61914.1 adenylosuccinate synthase [Lentimicrobium sp.]
MKIDVLLGLQWGDEGKGKITDVLTPDYDIIARFQGGPNAGHTLEFNGIKHVLHTIPSGIFHPEKINVVGNGVIIDPYILARELKKLRDRGARPELNMLISKRAHLILPTHRLIDAVEEASKGSAKIGSTLKGIGPTYTDKTGRHGLRIGDTQFPGLRDKYKALKNQHMRIIESFNPDPDILRIENMMLEEYEQHWFESLDYISDIRLIDSEIFINQSMREGKKILAEGAQGTMLDIDFGTYPYVTSSNTISAGVCSGLGISPQNVGRVFGVFKAYCTRVGGGPFPTELLEETGEMLRDKGREFGSTTGRPRRCGWLDLPALRYSVMLNGVTDLVMMKADVLDEFETISVCTGYKIGDEVFEFPGYDTLNQAIEPVLSQFPGWLTPISDCRSWEELPENFRNYTDALGEQLGLPVTVLSVGPNRDQTIIRKT